MAHSILTIKADLPTYMAHVKSSDQMTQIQTWAHLTPSIQPGMNSLGLMGHLRAKSTQQYLGPTRPSLSREEVHVLGPIAQLQTNCPRPRIGPLDCLEDDSDPHASARSTPTAQLCYIRKRARFTFSISQQVRVIRPTSSHRSKFNKMYIGPGYNSTTI